MPRTASRSPGAAGHGAPAPTLADVQAARGAIDGIAVRTPLVHAGSLSDAFGTAVWLKLETLQPVGSFKVRGTEVRRVGASQDDAQVAVDRPVAAQGLCEIGPFDDPGVIAGQGTLGLETLEDLPEPGTVVVPLSGRGLADGIAALAARLLEPFPGPLVLVVSGRNFDPGLWRRIAAGHAVTVGDLEVGQGQKW